MRHHQGEARNFQRLAVSRQIVLLLASIILGLSGVQGFGVISNTNGNGNSFHTTTTESTRLSSSSPPLPKPATRGPSSSTTIAKRTKSTSTSLNAFGMEDVSHLYEIYPLQSAIVTCGVKASVADAIAQVQAFLKLQQASSNDDDDDNNELNLEFKRNIAYFIYGSMFVGAMCHVEYNILFPYLFGTSHDWTTVIKKVMFDDFISGPWLWLPPAYFIKAIMLDYPLSEGWQKYVHDVKHEGLLLKYWALWIPAQSITFSVIPDHLRVAFMASVSFFWFILFSALSANSDNASQQELMAVQEDHDEVEFATLGSSRSAVLATNSTASF